MDVEEIGIMDRVRMRKLDDLAVIEVMHEPDSDSYQLVMGIGIEKKNADHPAPEDDTDNLHPERNTGCCQPVSQRRNTARGIEAIVPASRARCAPG